MGLNLSNVPFFKSLVSGHATPNPTLGLSPPLSTAEGIDLLKKYSPPSDQAVSISGAKSQNKNIWVPNEGLRLFPQVLKKDPFFKEIHRGGIHKRLSHQDRLKVVEYVAGVKLFDDEKQGGQHLDRLRDELSDEDIIKILAFFGEEAVTLEGQKELIKLARLGWSHHELVDKEGKPHEFVFDFDDTRASSWHVGDLSVKAFFKAINHFVFKDIPSTLIGRLMRGGAESVYYWGGHTFKTQMRVCAFFIFRMLRFNQLMSIDTHGDRNTLYLHAKNFTGFRASLLGLLPYQEPQKQDVMNNTENIYTLKDHAQSIKRLTRLVSLLAQEKNGANGPLVFDKLDSRLKKETALLLFGKKTYKAKSAVLRNLKDDGQIHQPALALIDNAAMNGRAALVTKTQSFIHIQDRPPGLLAQVGFFASTEFYAAIARAVKSVSSVLSRIVPNKIGVFLMMAGDSLFNWLNQKGTLNQLPAQNYGDGPVVQALREVANDNKSRLIDLSHQTQSEGLSGIRLQRAEGVYVSYQELAAGFEKNRNMAKEAIKELRLLFRGIGELEAVKVYYKQEVWPLIKKM